MSDQHVIDIRREYDEVEECSTVTLAKKYRVNKSTIRHIIHYLGAYADV